MSASYVSSSQPMSGGRINYHAPLKSVRTRRAIVVQEPPKLSFDGSEDGRTSPKEGEVKRPGVSFMWENAPGKPKIEGKEELIAPAELKPPPQSLPSIKARDTAVSSPPPAGTPPAKVNPFASLPPKPSPPPSKTTTTSMQQTTDRTPPRSHPVVPKSSTPARRSVTPTRQSRSGDNSSKADDLRNPVERDRKGTAITESRNSHNSLDRGGSHHYASEYVRQPLPAQTAFYFPPRNAPSTAVPKRSYPSQPSSRLPTLPGNHDNSEGGSHTSAEWDGEHNSDAGDIYSQMDHYQAQCQVSMLDGCIEPDLPDTSRHTDPRARDFIMQRFLPAAKAMVTESSDANDRRSPNGTPEGSPRNGSRSAAAGRSRFATFKQRSDAENEETAEEEDPGMLFKCKFPWQVSSFGSLCLPAPAPPQHGVTKGKADGKPVGEMEPAWTYADTEGSKDENSRSFESTGHPTTVRARNGTSTNTDGVMLQQQRDHDTLEHSQSFSTDSQTGDSYEGEGSMRSTDSRRAYSSNPSNREPAAPQTPPPRRKAEHEFAGNLGMLLRTSNPAGRGMGKLIQPMQQQNVAEAEARKQSQAESSSLNHPRYQSRPQIAPSGSLGDLGARDVDPGQLQSRSQASTSSSLPLLPNLSNNDDGNNYPRHLRQTLYRHDTAGGSGRSLESIDDEAWETIDRETSSSTAKNNRDDQQRSDRHGPALPPLTSMANSNLFDNTDDARAIGWPLGKAYSAFSRVSSTDSKQDSSYSRTPSTDSKHGSSYVRTASSESKAESAYTRTASNDSKYDSFYTRTPSSDSKHESPYARTPSNDSKNEYFSSFSDSPANYSQHKDSEKFSPVSVLQPPLPKAPRESWLGKLMPTAPAPLSNMSNWQQAGPKKFLEHSMTDDSMDVKWEALVKSENAQARNVRLAQDSLFSTNTGGT